MVEKYTNGVWGELEGYKKYGETTFDLSSFPASFQSGGLDMSDYRICGANDGVGEKTENLFDKNAKDTANGYISNHILRADGSTQYVGGYFISEYIAVKANTYYTLDYKSSLNTPAICFYDANKAYLSGFAYGGDNPITVKSPLGAAFCRFTSAVPIVDVTLFVEGSTAPAQYIPFGYQVNAEVGDSGTTTDIPIYIGDTPLAQGEYVDYGEQKVYKYVDGTLTPTDPPVALPALPTIDGATIVDFDNTPKPSRMTGEVIGWKTMTPKIYVKDHWVDLLDPSWADIQAMVQTGLHLIYFKIGDVLNVLYNGVSTPVVVIGLDHDIPTDPEKTHSMTLQFQNVIEVMQFDNKEALFAFPNGLSAGTYHFTITQHPWVSTDVGKTVQLTLETDIPAEGCLVLQNAYNVTLVGGKINSYASLSATTALESVTMTEGSDGTDLGDVSNSVSGNTNSLQRALLGSNNYNESAIRQWLNSSEASGSVWTPQTKWDRYPSWNVTYSGFLSRLDSNLISVIGTCTKRTAMNIVTDGGGYVDTTEKIFLISRTEAFGDKENNVAEGFKYDIYTDNASRVKTKSGTAKYWWVRSPNSTNAYYVRGVNTSGALYYYSAISAIGVVPAWIIC